MENRFETFTVNIAKISRYIRKIKSEETVYYNLKSSHVSCIYYLYINNNSLTAKELCELCDEDKAAISRAVDYLESNGYLTCDAKFEKRYNSPLSLTEKGKLVGQRTIEVIDDIYNRVSEGVSEEDRENFYRTLLQICDNLKKICDKYEDKEE